MLELLSDPNAWAALVTLTVLEIVLGIDNVVFISILVSRCDPHLAKRARQIGLSLALVFRIVMLFGLTFLMKLTQPLFSVYGLGFSWRDFILIGGGLFLIAKATHEIHGEVEARDHHPEAGGVPQSFAFVVAQLIAVDLIFSLDSIITAVGMVDDVRVMIAAVIASLGLMMWFARPIGEFVDTHPSIKMLALSFLVVVGVVLVAEGFGHHVPKGYVYFAMAFSFAVELLNIRFRKTRAKPVKLRDAMPKDEPR